ncbi:MAG: N-6 DNA methylase [Chitinispirillales bacterium]|jgi:type I restriction-modification system DNA methylase subunit|nr:N-6 DNA methylase [Chitinispirillales bacterium]
MRTKEEAYKKIKSLVERFDEQKEFYKNKDYNETQTRLDFINPFWKALGWDIDNENGYAESYREVILEDHVKVGTATKTPDYSFRLVGGKRLFFLEAKRPSVVIKDDIDSAYQIRRYGWSAKMPVSVITDFEEFAVYDCSPKPNPTDKASVARIKYLTFKEYLTEFDFIWDTFGKECVLKGSFDKYIQNDKNKKGTTTVDDDFLSSLNLWRKNLAKNIASRNEIDEERLNFAVQHILDRIIFLRIAEDRGVERYGELRETTDHGDYYANLLRLFHVACQKYNSGIFDFQHDKISDDITIDNKVIKSIIDELYYPKSPYEFSVLSVEIFGSAYEQFLGKTISLSKSGYAIIEDQPEIRKAGGVYYTPQYIVDYIVKNTVGRLVEDKTPKEASTIRIVDPACGSGGFLLGAYQFLLNWHKDFYTQNRKHGQGGKSNPLTPWGELTTAEKKRILLNNIYGVDLDANAVEVTKLSLLLKCMEGETKETVEAQTKLFHDRVLPAMENNIKCGNSIIDLDYYDNEFDFGEERKIKPFSWKKGFPEVFKQGGFDCVIGNPPWVDIKGHPVELVKYYFNNFHSTENRINLYSIFVEKGLGLLNNRGFLGFIIPNSLLYQSSYEKIRRIILGEWRVDSIVRLPDNVFYGVKAETIILTINKTSKQTRCLLYDRNDTVSSVDIKTAHKTNTVRSKEWINNEFSVFDIFSSKQEKDLLKKIETDKTYLSELCDFTLGITPYDKYRGHTQKQITERIFHSSSKKNKTFKRLLDGADVKRYFVEWGKKEYISYGDWLGASRQKKFFTSPRILVRQIVGGNPLKIYAGYTEEELYNVQSIFNIVAKEDCNVSLKYLLAIINSNVMNFYHSRKYLDLSKNLFQKILIQNCKKFPIKTIAPKNKTEIQQQQAIVKYVDRLLQLNKYLQTATLPSQTERLRQRIAHCENQIDAVVYGLYELTKGEIELIENNAY